MQTPIDRVDTGALAQGTAQGTRDTGAAPHAASDFAITGTDADDADAPIPFSVPADAWPIPFALTERGAAS